MILSILTLLIAALVSGRIRPVLAFLSALGAFVLLGYLSVEEALANVVNPSLVTLMLLITLSVAVQKTPFVTGLGDRLLNTGYRRAIGRLFFVVSSASAVVNNTAVVASLISTVRQNNYFSPSRVLIPLSYASIFGGGLTLIGSSTNMIVNSLVIQKGLEPLNFFTFTGLGLIMAGLGCCMLLVFGQRLLVNRDTQPADTQHYFVEARVEADSPLIGKSIADNGLRHLNQLFLAEIIRGDLLISSVMPSEVIEQGDVLVFSGDVQSVQLLNNFQGLALFSQNLPDSIKEQLGSNLVEVFISHQSVLVGKTIKNVNFRTQFDAAVVAIRRGSEQLAGGLGGVRLQTGDSLVLAVGSDFHQHRNLDRNFYLITGVAVENFLSNRQSIGVLSSFAIVLLMAMMGIYPLINGLFVLLGGYIAFGVLSLEEIRRRFPFEMLAIVAATLGIAQVIISSGTAAQLADTVAALTDHWGMFGGLVGVYLITLLCTEFINNNAAAALVFPVAIEMAQRWAVEPMPFIIAIIFGASASFVSPFGYQTNLMVFSAGNYQIKDYVRIGLPLSIVYSVVVLNLIPIFFPFT